MTKTDHIIWASIQTICWFIFVGYAVQTGALVFTFIYSLFKPIVADNLHLGLNLAALYSKSIVVYSLVVATIIGVSALKAYVFFIVIKLLKLLNLVKPFSTDVAAVINKITCFAFSIGILGLLAHQVVKKVIAKGYDATLAERYWTDGSAYLMMSAILFVIAMIFKKGIELQTDNDLTI
jgi:hypothetical protein